jgi:eukaryotic-like serine/threonine-protein kinase
MTGHDAPTGRPADEATTCLVGAGLVGRTVSHYRILAKLGEGGMGIVYKAVDDRLHRTVALKFLPPRVGDDLESSRRLAQEARAASALDHPNIVVVHDIDVTPEGAMFIAMAFHEGDTLQARIRAGLSVRDAVDFARQIALGLEHAHLRHVVHRDIKPANVIVSGDGIARIVDFGLARPADAMASLDGSIKGTPAYMSPEQAAAESVDQRTDLWSLGAVLYEMLTGSRPFAGDTTIGILHAIATKTPAPVRRLRPEVPDVVASIVDRALEKEPARRYQSATEMAQDLFAALFTLSAPPLAPSRSERWSRRPVVATVVATVVILASALAAGTWLYARSARRAWVREEAIPQIAALRRQDKPLAAFLLLRRAESARVVPGHGARAARHDSRRRRAVGRDGRVPRLAGPVRSSGV